MHQVKNYQDFLKWLFTLHFKFQHTGNNPVTYTVTTGKLIPAGQMRVKKLVQFSFYIHHGQGRQHKIADNFSGTSIKYYIQISKAYKEFISTDIAEAIPDGTKSK